MLQLFENASGFLKSEFRMTSSAVRAVLNFLVLTPIFAGNKTAV